MKTNNVYIERKKYYLDFKNHIDELSFYAMAKEPCIWPSFGLVTPKDVGAHDDMNYNLLIKSARRIAPYFYLCFKVGCNLQYSKEEKFFASKHIGIDAEKDMLMATNNINTHKGTIFLFTILCTSLGMIIVEKDNISKQYENFNIVEFWNKVLEIAYDLSNKYILDEIGAIKCIGLSQTYGEWSTNKYNLSGIRNLVTTNFRVLRYALRYYLHLTKISQNKELILGQLRVYFLAYSNDTNIIKRAGIKKACQVRELACKSLKAGGVFTRKGQNIIISLEALMKKNKWSAAAAGDLMIVILFMVDSYESIFFKNR